MLIRRLLHIIFSVFMAVLLLFGSTSKELVHSFAHHRDTVHHRHDGFLSLEGRHHHCSFLSFELTPFEYEALQYELPFYELPLFEEKAVAVVPLCGRTVVYRSLRAPPGEC